MNIGDWVRRTGKWHRVESIVAGAAITRCGRRMEPVVGGRELEVSAVYPASRASLLAIARLCKAGCDR